MIRSKANYAQTRLTQDKDTWHWSELFKGIVVGSDIDLHAVYRGWHLFAESKPLGVSMRGGQAANLESLARLPQCDAILVGTKQIGVDLLTPDGIAVAWVWVRPGQRWWRDKAHIRWGSQYDLQEEVSAWKQHVDLRLDAANEESFMPPPDSV